MSKSVLILTWTRGSPYVPAVYFVRSGGKADRLYEKVSAASMARLDKALENLGNKASITTKIDGISAFIIY
jgi:hypothetical protein